MDFSSSGLNRARGRHWLDADRQQGHWLPAVVAEHRGAGVWHDGWREHHLQQQPEATAPSLPSPAALTRSRAFIVIEALRYLPFPAPPPPPTKAPPPAPPPHDRATDGTSRAAPGPPPAPAPTAVAAPAPEVSPAPAALPRATACTCQSPPVGCHPSPPQTDSPAHRAAPHRPGRGGGCRDRAWHDRS
jgi:hypothetical protein